MEAPGEGRKAKAGAPALGLPCWEEATRPRRAMPDPIPRSALPGLAFPALPARERSHLLAIQFQLGQSQWWKPEELRAAQWLQLGPLLAHAAATSPYYRDLFARHGIVPPAKPDDDLFRRIPVSTRADLQAAGDALHSLSVPPSHGKVAPARTSGSSGQPLALRRTAAWMEIWSSLAIREYFWQRRDFSKALGAIRFFPNSGAPWPDGAKSDTWSPYLGALYPTGPGYGLNVAADPGQQLEWLDRTRPDYLTSFPTNLLGLVDHARRAGRELPRVLELRTVGETLTPDQRQRLTEAWKAPVTDMYTCEEVGYLALQCPDHPGYHVQAEHVILEVLDDQGLPCAPGQAGRVVLTDLHNFATPFIRYDIGDIAEAGAPCPCGRGLPTLRQILGRSRSRLTLPDGRKILPRFDEALMEVSGDSAPRHFRVIQRSLTVIEVEVVADRPLDDAQQAKVAEGIRRSTGHPFEIRFAFPEAIPPSPNGKRAIFFSDLP